MINMSRGFGSTLGVGTTDAMTLSNNEHYPQSTFLIWSWRNGDGSSGGPRLVDKRVVTESVKILNEVSASTYNFQHTWSGAEGSWRVPEPTANAWHSMTVRYDSTSTTNDPLIEIDGEPQIVTEASTPVGTAVTTTDRWNLGNRTSDSARDWDGALTEFAVWNRLLSDYEIRLIGKGWSALWFPVGLKIYMPGYMEADLFGAPPTIITGTRPFGGIR
jgi:hypothetical protein